MAVKIREFVGDIPKQINSILKTQPHLKEALNPYKNVKKGAIIQLIEGIHVGPTGNFTRYRKEGLINSIDSWTSPYNKPLIMHHNEEDGKIIGRVLKVDYREGNTRNGKGALIFTCYVTDPDGVEQIKDGRLSTVSVGAIGTDIRCSICGKYIEVDDDGRNIGCEHQKGNMYGTEIAYWDIFNMEAKELSYVIVPSDKYAHNLETYDAEEYFNQQNKTTLKENLQEGVASKMAENKQNQGQVIDESIKADATKVAVEGEENNKEPEVNTAESNNEGEKPETKQKDDDKLTKNEKRIKDLEKELEDLKKENEELKADKATMKEEAAKAAEKLEDALKDIKVTKEELKSEVALRESAETEVMNMRAELRESREKELNDLRVSLGRQPLLKEALEKRSNESLQDAIVDLKEELNSREALKQTSKVEDPTILKEKNENNKNVNVKEQKTAGNINLEEALESTLLKLF